MLMSTKVSKYALNISYAEYIWSNILTEWYRESPIDNFTKISDTNEPDFWFYVPEFSKERQQLEVRCVDSSHLLTRARRKLCKGGIEKISNETWLKVAKQKKTFLSQVMVEDISDPMSVPMALAHISESVEKAMRENADYEAANLCHDIRLWWLAEDEPGIPAEDRIHMRSAIRRRLLGYVKFGTFPPPRQYVNGWPIQLWEALLASIDSKALLYALSKTKSYNVRAFSSLIGETFFSELTNNDKKGNGTVSSDEFASFVGNAVEQMQTRLDPERCFSYRTSKSTVYKLLEQTVEQNIHVPMDNTGIDRPSQLAQLPITLLGRSVIPRDHSFDSEERRRVKGRTKTSYISTDRNSIQKGTLGIRWEKSRINESKILPSLKMGLPD